jgi:hypothetical protein
MVHGVKRRSSSFNTGRIDHSFEDLRPDSYRDARCFFETNRNDLTMGHFTVGDRENSLLSAFMLGEITKARKIAPLPD